MRRCLELAVQGAGIVSPNPMVGCVIVHNGSIIGEGYHHEFGGAHAEVLAIRNVKDKTLLTDSVLYVSLEPCCHHGKTPPCSDLIISSGIKKVVTGATDPNPSVAGKGIEQMRSHGIEVLTGVLDQECRHVNRRFFCFHNEKRPYIILKWAETADRFIDSVRLPGEVAHANWITCEETRVLVHRWRTEEDAILVGTNTALLDNPKLNARDWVGKNPLRLTIDRFGKLPRTLHLFDGKAPTLVFCGPIGMVYPNAEVCSLDFSQSILPGIMKELYRRNILSLIVEGGKELLDSFISCGLWDEALIFSAPMRYNAGTKAPDISGEQISEESFGTDVLQKLVNLNKNQSAV